MIQIEFACKVVRRPKKISDKSWDMFVRHVCGAGQKELAIEYGISPPRVRQICLKISRMSRWRYKHPDISNLYEPNSSVYLRPTDDLRKRLDAAGWTRKELEESKERFGTEHDDIYLKPSGVVVPSYSDLMAANRQA
jgi:hypothetical protein